MNSKEREINKLINQKQQSLEAEKNKKEEYNQSLVELYKRLKKDINELIYLSFEDIKDLISKFEVDDYDKLVNDITTIKKILTLNKDYKSTLRLFKKDKDNYNYFLECFNKFNDYNKDHDKDIKKIEEEQKKYSKLQENLANHSYKLRSKDMDLIEALFINNLEEGNEKILIKLLDTEFRRYNDLLIKSKKKVKAALTNENLEKLFKEYNYDYNLLEDDYKKILIDKGNLKNIEDIFITLNKFAYPHITDNYVLTSILVASTKSTIQQVTTFAMENKLIPKSLLDISGAILTQNDNESDSDYSIMTKGSSIDFMRNIITLKNAGISINYIYQACKSILTMPNQLLEKNLDLFSKYGFSFEYKKRGIIDPSPCALLSNNFAQIADAFIEIHEFGLKYLIDNLSNLKTVSNPDALMFYNIYESAKNYKGNISNPEDGPFRVVMEEDNENYQLKAIITRNRPDYRNTYYMNINEENKHGVTNTIIPDIKNKNKFNKIIDTYPNTISNSIFSNPYIQSINKYIDQDNALIYNFLGIRISRLKVLRIYNTLLKNGIKDSIDSFMFAITYNTIINLENYNKVYEIIQKEIENR